VNSQRNELALKPRADIDKIERQRGREAVKKPKVERHRKKEKLQRTEKLS